MSHKELFLEKIKKYESDPDYILYSLIFEINEEICKALERNNLNYKQFAEKLNVKPAYISKLLNGQPNLSIKSLVKIALALNLKIRQPFYKGLADEIFVSCQDIRIGRVSPDYRNVSYSGHRIEVPNEGNPALAA